eukprot:4010215-Amphidinium_carterae.1
MLLVVQFGGVPSNPRGIGVRGGRLALVPGAPGWQSARCPTYPQEVLLELQSAAEINLVEVPVLISQLTSMLS